jgi:hypothetical protein
MEYTFGRHMEKNTYHVPLIRAQLTRVLPQLVPAIHEEVVDTFNEFIPPTSGEIGTFYRLPYYADIRIDWISVKASETFTNLVCRVSNRSFVGRPLCEPSSILVLKPLSDMSQ